MFQITWDIDPILLKLGPLSFRYYGLLFLGVFLGGTNLFRWQVVRAGGSERQAGAIVITGVVSVLVGARLGHVFFYEFERAMADPLWIFQFWKGGLASHGATLGLLVGLYVWSRQWKQSYIEVLDRFAWSAALATILVRVGNFFNSEIVGRATDQTWGVRFPRYSKDRALELVSVPFRHPSQLYEALMGCAVFALLLLVDRAAGREKRPRGLMIATFFAAYFTGRFLVEFFKEYQTLSSDFPLTMGQILSLVPATVGYLGVAWALRAKVPNSWTPDPTPDAQ